jgi:phosphoribosyl-ATP pyrophosphohydrolase
MMLFLVTAAPDVDSHRWRERCQWYVLFKSCLLIYDKPKTPENPVVLHQLMSVIQDRKNNPPPRSYTSALFQGGVSAIGAKVLEEAQEVVEAAGEPSEEGQQHLVNEAADLIYHLLVLLAVRDRSLNDVEQVLAARFGISGIDEKESRAK